MKLLINPTVCTVRQLLLPVHYVQQETSNDNNIRGGGVHVGVINAAS